MHQAWPEVSCYLDYSDVENRNNQYAIIFNLSKLNTFPLLLLNFRIPTDSGLTFASAKRKT